MWAATNSPWRERYDASGSPVGGQFQINTFTTGNQRVPSVASDSNGNFVVAWKTYAIPGTSGFRSVHGQRYAADGSAVGPEFQVNTYTTATYQDAPKIASDSDGQFVVVWENRGSPGNDSDGYSVQGQLPEPPVQPSLCAMFALVLALARRRADSRFGMVRRHRSACAGNEVRAARSSR